MAKNRSIIRHILKTVQYMSHKEVAHGLLASVVRPRYCEMPERFKISKVETHILHHTIKRCF